MTKALQNPRGTYDALPELAKRFAFIENKARQVFATRGYGEIRTPVFEYADVFMRTVGDTTDIVSKEMYLFNDRNGEKMALRPEGTAGVVRAFYSNGLKQHLPLKLFYVGTPMFRYERPQKGRYRQFHQIGVECFGVASPNADVEVIATGVALLKSVGLSGDIVVKLNSLGTKEDREQYRQKLLAYFEPVQEQLSKESQERLSKNPLRILDSKEKEDKPFIKDAPRPLDSLCEESKKHFDAVKKGLEALDIQFEIDTSLVRGLDYYTHTVFEIHGEGLGAQSQVIGGGRFDGLVEQMGGESVPAVGFGCGMERLESIMEQQMSDERPVAFAVMDDVAYLSCLQLAENLRLDGVPCYLPLELTSFKSQMKKANKVNARYTVIVGEDELKRKIFQVKDMEEGTQQELTFLDAVDLFRGEYGVCKGS
ncbi:MAG: histidine--tRNA ligase [Magnetococcales bacterium]|nr:histidine--tRNA ligase [Magnetococcales bacterium]|tara:strand:+ start:12665 stop:13936 length:1272 start_codon:yes stop_codon:yes gene_type:complete